IYDNDKLHQLHETFQSIVVHLLSDNDSNVKRAFLTHSAGKLCTFFGAQKAKEVILSHMITFLNDKSNWELHIAFFEAIVDVVSQIGERSLDVLEALLQQDSNVKRAFLTHSAGKLCTFFGAQKAKEVILSHMITFLNDKSNWELHIAFFEAIVDVVSQIGERSLDVLEALLQQFSSH
ncbi:PREDICTED: phosphoinositide 3-kinase regulatory subunit 4-like, partial [Amphimedon queenslandica]|uniref:Phosphatase 2A Regulatory Subunit A helical domain-containing protein n=2 Tax=Amphimedon queenslandica TaxID=400682 RepID=A0AAN0JVN3_AMPQE